VTRAVVTGIGCISAAGFGPAALDEARSAGVPLGRPETTETVRGRRREIRVARLAAFDREAHLPAAKLRRMEEPSQLWTIACLLARADAGLAIPAAAERHPPERRGMFCGTGFGCLETTREYLDELFRDGAGEASPFLFSQSVANAPSGHSAIELDTRGTSVTLTCADASADAALAAGARAIEQGRATVAYCGGVELLPPTLLRVLASLGGPRFLGEGCVALVLEARDAARERGARIHAEIRGWASTSDPTCAPTEWTRDSGTIEAALRGALGAAHATDAAEVGTVFLGTAAERRAAAAVCPGARHVSTDDVFGSFAAAGGIGLVAAIVQASSAGARSPVVRSASAWGGGVFCTALSP
jgi:3-oxoacyl-[acyl-carrier-protein] synthase II